MNARATNYTFALFAAAAVLAGCGTNGGAMSPAATNAVANSVLHHALPYGARPRSSGVSRRAGSKGDVYLYGSDYGANAVDVYGYNSKTGMFGSEVGSTSSGISGPQGLCASAKGEVYVANTNDLNILGYRAPSTTSNANLSDAGYYPVGCAVDKQGDVAVSNICNAPYCEGGGGVSIYKNGTGSPTSATCPNINRAYFDAYDPKGDLFVDGEDSSYAFALCEIKAGETTGRAVQLNPAPEVPGGDQWYRGDLVVADQDTGTLDLYKIKHSSGKLVKTVTLSDASDPVGFCIFGKYVIVASAGSASLASYKFPAGGAPVDTLSGFSEPIAVAVAK
jgi:hypothetical protein